MQPTGPGNQDRKGRVADSQNKVYGDDIRKDADKIYDEAALHESIKVELFGAYRKKVKATEHIKTHRKASFAAETVAETADMSSPSSAYESPAA